MASLWIRSGYDMKLGKSVETHQVGAHFEALIKAILVAPSRALEKFFSFHVSLPRCDCSKCVVSSLPVRATCHWLKAHSISWWCLGPDLPSSFLPQRRSTRRTSGASGGAAGGKGRLFGCISDTRKSSVCFERKKGTVRISAVIDTPSVQQK